MAAAMMYPEPARLKRKADVSSGNINEVNKVTLSRARYVLKHPDLTAQVMGGLSLNKAFDQAKLRDTAGQGVGDVARRYGLGARV